MSAVFLGYLIINEGNLTFLLERGCNEPLPSKNKNTHKKKKPERIFNLPPSKYSIHHDLNQVDICDFPRVVCLNIHYILHNGMICPDESLIETKWEKLIKSCGSVISYFIYALEKYALSKKENLKKLLPEINICLISYHFSFRKIITYIFQIYLWKKRFIVKNWKDPKNGKFYYIMRRGKIFVSWKSRSWILCYSTPLTWLCSPRTCCISNNSFRFGGMTRLTVYVRPFWRTLKYLL